MADELTDGERTKLREQLATLQKSHLGMRLYIALWDAPSGQPDDILRTLLAHLEFLHDLELRGILFASGPLADNDDPGPPGPGMSIFRVATMDEARALVEAEPFVKAGLRTYTLKRWTFNEGSITLRANVGVGTYEIV